MDRIGLRLSTVRDIDGVWVGAFTNQDEPVLRRVAAALQLMKQQSPLHYSRVIRNLDRIWITTLPDARAQYSCRLNACELDERFVVADETTPEVIASAIVHETTHARLERYGVAYDEAKRHRIEAICLRRELNFVSGLAGCGALQEELRRSRSMEVAWRAQQLLEKLCQSPTSPEELRRSRALEVLQRVGTPAARELLKLNPPSIRQEPTTVLSPAQMFWP